MQYQEKLEVLKQLELTNNYTENIEKFLENYARVVENDEMFKENKGITLNSERHIVTVITKEEYKFEVSIEDVKYISN